MCPRAFWGLSLALVAAPSAAQEHATKVTASADAARGGEQQPDETRPQHRLVWRFPRFRTWQYVAVGVQTAANLTLELADVPSRTTDWRSPLFIDAPVREALLAESQEGRDRAATVSDVMWYTTQFYTVIVDSLLVPLAFDDWNTDVALQMTMINWQVLGLTGIITRIAHHTGGRARPSNYDCVPEPGDSLPCGEPGSSFFAGHVSMTTAGAALACAHHAALPLYGDGPAGAITCALLAASSVTVGVLRIVPDKHWMSDVIVGHLVGAGVGFGLPWLLHYQHPLTPKLSSLGVTHVAWLPWATADSMSLSLVGAF